MTDLAGGEDDDGDAEDERFSAGPSRRVPMTANGRQSATSNGGSPSTKKRQERKRQERKASVRKEQYQIEETESDLTDAPDENEEGSIGGAETESDEEMARKLQAAGDGESLLGSATSDRDQGETDEEEERFIIEDTNRRQAKAHHRRRSARDATNSTTHRHGGNENTLEDEEEQSMDDLYTGTMSPRTLQQLGLNDFEDELFEPQEAFHSSSEPSFTDFFGTDSEEEKEDEIALKPRHDDDELTTDDDEDSDVTEISDLDEAMLSAAFLSSEALAAGVSTQMTASTLGGGEAIPGDIPLLVIEDLDGRLIYARAGDGEAVFGSDGEFEVIDDSDEDDTDEDMDGLGYDYRGNGDWAERRALGDDQFGMDSDEGDTTDELPNEDMPFPRLLVGSVAPNGGRNARRARAMAVRSRKLSPNVGAAEHTRGGDVTSGAKASVAIPSSTNTTPSEGGEEIDFSISIEALARDPKGTLETAAKSLGLTPEEVARLVAGIENGSSSSTEVEGKTVEDTLNKADETNGGLLSPTSSTTALPITPASKPPMGSFMPTSFKSIHRAVIDGNRQAPSPFANRYGMQKRGLANRKRNSSTNTPSSKRLRRFSSVDVISQGTCEETSEGGGTKSSSREASPINPMDLDDVVNASMLWRGSYSSSPPGISTAAAGVPSSSHAEGEQQTTPMMRAAKRGASSTTTTPPKEAATAATAGLNLNAFARWHRIPMGAFRDGQGQTSSTSTMSQQPLGSFLLTRSRQNMNQMQSRRKQKASLLDQSPFRGRGERESVHLGAAPQHRNINGHSDAFIVSPVLWPVGHGEMASEGHNNAAIWYTPKAMQPIVNAEAETTSKKLMTKREKRQRKARRAAAFNSITQQADGRTFSPSALSLAGSPAPDSRSNRLLDSPASALPKLSLTDASPHASPLPISKPLAPSSLQFSYRDVDVMDQASSNEGANAHNGLSSSPSNPFNSHNNHQQVPSSVFGIPLHSPLFSGIFNPTNLGFRDDLEERDDEGLLTI
ncbi:hypothetical protein CBS101457_000995 [Exobasidium rhododendri]|nr:hypothetical protein CBS101457_000995 [Exobasidium rhododendri]